MEMVNLIVNILSSFGTIVALAALGYQVIKERGEKKKEQADKISTWIDNENMTGDAEDRQVIIIYNQSNYPIYEVIFSIDDLYGIKGSVGKGDKRCSCIDILPPGKYAVEKAFEDFGMNHRFNSSITFRDNYGKYWTRDARGVLTRERGKCVIEKRKDVYQPYSKTMYQKIKE